jgi:hypothetical protein
MITWAPWFFVGLGTLNACLAAYKDDGDLFDWGLAFAYLIIGIGMLFYA